MGNTEESDDERQLAPFNTTSNNTVEPTSNNATSDPQPRCFGEGPSIKRTHTERDSHASEDDRARPSTKRQTPQKLRKDSVHEARPAKTGRDKAARTLSLGVNMLAPMGMSMEEHQMILTLANDTDDPAAITLQEIPAAAEVPPESSPSRSSPEEGLIATPVRQGKPQEPCVNQPPTPENFEKDFPPLPTSNSPKPTRNQATKRGGLNTPSVPSGQDVVDLSGADGDNLEATIRDRAAHCALMQCAFNHRAWMMLSIHNKLIAFCDGKQKLSWNELSTLLNRANRLGSEGETFIGQLGTTINVLEGLQRLARDNISREQDDMQRLGETTDAKNKDDVFLGLKRLRESISKKKDAVERLQYALDTVLELGTVRIKGSRPGRPSETTDSGLPRASELASDRREGRTYAATVREASSPDDTDKTKVSELSKANELASDDSEVCAEAVVAEEVWSRCDTDKTGIANGAAMPGPFSIGPPDEREGLGALLKLAVASDAASVPEDQTVPSTTTANTNHIFHKAPISGLVVTPPTAKNPMFHLREMESVPDIVVDSVGTDGTTHSHEVSFIHGYRVQPIWKDKNKEGEFSADVNVGSVEQQIKEAKEPHLAAVHQELRCLGCLDGDNKCNTSEAGGTRVACYCCDEAKKPCIIGMHGKLVGLPQRVIDADE